MGAADVNAELLADVLNYLDITWSDEPTDRKISGLIAGGIAYLDSKLGTEDYTVPGLPRSLLFDYVRYARDGALDVFENNYGSMIIGAQNDKAVKQYAAQNPEPQAE